MRITSEKGFINKVNEGFRLEKLDQFKRTLWYLTNNKEEFTVSISLIEKLRKKGIVDSNWDIHLPCKVEQKQKDIEERHCQG